MRLSAAVAGFAQPPARVGNAGYGDVYGYDPAAFHLFHGAPLFLYYVFQPFTTELNVKNPFYRILNMAVYILCFICMEIRTGSMGFTLIVLGFTAAYIAVALILVYRFAPKTFRVK